jgi:hypothetical protein
VNAGIARERVTPVQGRFHVIVYAVLAQLRGCDADHMRNSWEFLG